MFSKLHHTKFQHLPQPPHHHSSAAAVDYPPTSQEADSNSHSPSPDRHRNAAAKDGLLPYPLGPASNDGATIEVVRRPRGRPPGSKNKPKPPVIITRDSAEPAMSPYVLELPAGVDIIESTTRFCRKRNMGLCLLNGNGVVTNVTLNQPSTTPGTTVTFHGRFDILSISATILPPGAAAAANGPFALSLAGPQGQVVGGHVVGPLVSAGTIYLVAANFSNPSFHRLQQVDHHVEQEESGGHDSPKTSSGGGGGSVPPTSMYSYQAADVIWAPATRQQPPPPPPPY
ncbi:putative AT-hook DNA-binding family protein [Perilla frutescens var. hirtella]|nr:putative AT-hook DNA-binding family protein [Perilla frutescens var. frutescens]KAH6776432.1 putative AT-hook DNA-binding family protein [Perilla frutescens var. hirtella]